MSKAVTLEVELSNTAASVLCIEPVVSSPPNTTLILCKYCDAECWSCGKTGEPGKCWNCGAPL